MIEKCGSVLRGILEDGRIIEHGGSGRQTVKI